MATVDADGAVLGLALTGPFGESLPTQPQVNGMTTSTPWNTLNGATFGYVGQHEKLTEAKLAVAPIQMGARVYIPGLGRFLSVDHVQDGTPNNYVYTPDPVNQNDYSGQFAIGAVAYGVFQVVAVAAVIMLTVYVISTPQNKAIQREAYGNLARSITQAVSQAVARPSVRTESKPKDKPNQGCSSYSPAPPPYTTIAPRTAAAMGAQPTVGVGVGMIQASLSLGVKPSTDTITPRAGWGNQLFQGGWSKYSLKTANGRDFHYSVNEDLCVYTDIKEKSIEDGIFR